MYIRRYVTSDWGRVITMARSFHAESPVHSPHPFSLKGVRQLLDTAVERTDWYPAVCIDGDAIIGMMLLFHMPMFFSDATEVGDLTFYVVPEKRGTRAAYMMLKAAEKWAEDCDASVLRIGITTGIAAEQVQSFFEKMGHRQIGVLMEKKL